MSDWMTNARSTLDNPVVADTGRGTVSVKKSVSQKRKAPSGSKKVKGKQTQRNEELSVQGL